MADFDAIYEDNVLDEGAAVVVDEHDDDRHVALIPDPIVIRGAGNMTV